MVLKPNNKERSKNRCYSEESPEEALHDTRGK